VADHEVSKPVESDARIPRNEDLELADRLSLFHGRREALRQAERPLESLGVLDLDCGDGRSTRLHLDFVCRPQQLTGVDSREGVIRLARSQHPTIQFEVRSSHALANLGQTFAFVSINLVVSSI
jgi:ubiquinone/menaquinone biosynthesis C-methylase UbiE